MLHKWEYKIYATETISVREVERNLNELGQSGWELVAVVENDSSPEYFEFYLKRPVLLVE